MLIALIITGGIVLISALGMLTDLAAKKNKRMNDSERRRIAELEERLSRLEVTVDSRNEEILKLQTDLSFMTKLLEKK